MQNTIKNTLEKNKLRFQTLINDSSRTVYKLGIGLENGKADTIIDIHTDSEKVLIYTTCPTIVPMNQRPRVAEFITRANQGLFIGNFELDFEDGELRYKSNYIYDDTFPNSESVFEKNLFATFHMMDKYLPGIMSVIYANILPSQAIIQIEKSANPTMN